MNTSAALASLLLLVSAPAALAAGGPAHAGDKTHSRAGQTMSPHDCDETEDCFAEGLGLSNDQQEKVRDILEEARKRRDELREDTYNQLKDVLTPEQGRKLEAHRADLMKYRAERMREHADRLDQRARNMKPASNAPRREDAAPAAR